MPFPYFVLKASSLRSLKHKIVWYRVKLVHLTLSQTTVFRRKNRHVWERVKKQKTLQWQFVSWNFCGICQRHCHYEFKAVF